MRGLGWILVIALLGAGFTTALGVVPVQAALPPIDPNPPPPPPIDPLPDPDPVPPPPPPPVHESPEPTSLGLLLIGAGIVGIRALRRRNARAPGDR